MRSVSARGMRVIITTIIKRMSLRAKAIFTIISAAPGLCTTSVLSSARRVRRPCIGSLKRLCGRLRGESCRDLLLMGGRNELPFLVLLLGKGREGRHIGVTGPWWLGRQMHLAGFVCMGGL